MTRSLKLARAHFPVVALFIYGATAMGCSADGGEEHQTNLRGLAAYYSQYKAKSRGEAPPNEEAFKQFIAADLSAAGAAMSAEEIDTMFISKRDGKPFVIRYKSEKAWPYPDFIAYEQEGRNGTRHVAYALGGVESLTEERFSGSK